MNLKKILVFTGSRSDFDRLFWVCQEIENHPRCELQLVVGNTHLSPEYGLTVEQIRETDLPVADEIEMLLSSKNKVGITKSIGVGCISLADSLSRLAPDIVLVLGDRYELLAVAASCICQNIPLAHIGGGQCTEGAIDEQIRHMVTKAAHLHFAANDNFANRIIQMGEEPWRVFVTGSPSIDYLVKASVLSRDELGKKLGLDLSIPTALVTYHPETLATSDHSVAVGELFGVLEELDLQLILTYPNGDVGSQEIIRRLKRLANKKQHKCYLTPSLGRQKFVSALQHVTLMIGNSSSGIVEAPTFNLPVVNIGNRQKGRMAAENVFTCGIKHHEIANSIQKALNYRMPECQRPYGDGHSSERILEDLLNVIDTHSMEELLIKKFHNYVN